MTNRTVGIIERTSAPTNRQPMRGLDEWMLDRELRPDATLYNPAAFVHVVLSVLSQ